VYATVTIVVASVMMLVQKVEEPPPVTAGVVEGLKPEGQQNAVVSAPEDPTLLLSHCEGQRPGE
jgi:hypothetical protein